MKKQTLQFATVTENGVVTRIGRSVILQPKTHFKGGSIKWYEDKLKEVRKQLHRVDGSFIQGSIPCTPIFNRPLKKQLIHYIHTWDSWKEIKQ